LARDLALHTGTIADIEAGKEGRPRDDHFCDLAGRTRRDGEHLEERCCGVLGGQGGSRISDHEGMWNYEVRR
jgi:hypothetical protein